MARGHKDYGQAQDTVIIHTVADLGELAARLGSPDVFQRSGNVIFMTDFENGIDDMIKDPQGTGSRIDLMGDRAYSGSCSARLIGGSDGGQRAYLTKKFHTVETNHMGIESTFSLNEDCEYFSIAMSIRDGVTRWVYQIFAAINDGEFQYYDSAGARIKLCDFDWGNNDLDHWHTMKLVVDLENDVYLRAYYNEEFFDLNTLIPWSVASADDPRLDMYGWTLSQAAKNGIAYMDNLIITINEP